MDFNLSEEQKELQNSARKFAQNELIEIAQQIEKTDEPPSIAVRKKYAELGYLGININESYGGSGGTHLDAVIVLEEIAKVSIGVAFPIFESCFGPCLAIAHFGNEKLKDWLLPKICSGDLILLFQCLNLMPGRL